MFLQVSKPEQYNQNRNRAAKNREKQAITIETENVSYYIMRSRDVKTEVNIDHFRFEIPRKHLIMLSLGTLQKSISPRNSP